MVSDDLPDWNALCLSPTVATSCLQQLLTVYLPHSLSHQLADSLIR